MNIIGLLLIVVALALVIYESVGFVRALRERKKNKHDENNEKGG